MFHWDIPSSVTIAIESTAEQDFHQAIQKKKWICFCSRSGGQKHIFLMSDKIKKISKHVE
jgi:hypothetical protein